MNVSSELDLVGMVTVLNGLKRLRPLAVIVSLNSLELMAFVELAFCCRPEKVDPMHAVRLQLGIAMEMVVEVHRSGKCVANLDTVESRAKRIAPNRAALKMDLVVPSVMVERLSPKTMDLNV